MTESYMVVCLTERLKTAILDKDVVAYLTRAEIFRI